MGLSQGRLGLLVAVFTLVVLDAIVIGVRGHSSGDQSMPAAAVVQASPSAPTVRAPGLPSPSPASPVPASPGPVETAPAQPSVRPRPSGFRMVPQRPLPAGSRLVTDSKGRFAARMYGTPRAVSVPSKFGPLRFTYNIEVSRDPLLIEVEGIHLSEPALGGFRAFADSSLSAYGQSSTFKELGHKNGAFRGHPAAFALYRKPDGTLVTLVVARWNLSEAYLIAVDSSYFDAVTRSFQAVGPHAPDTSGQAT